MYEYKFQNDPHLILCLKRMGSADLFDFFIPDLDVYFVSWGQATMGMARDLFIERVQPLFAGELRMEHLSSSIRSAMDDAPPELLTMADPSGGSFKRFFNYLANHVWTMDNQPEEALRQIEDGKFDSYAIRKKHLAELRQDPKYVAEDFVRRIASEHRFSSRLKDLAYISFGRIALKESRRDLSWYMRQSTSMVNHIADWLVAAVAMEAAWLSNVDDLGRPKKLMKFGSIESMYAEADRQMKRHFAKKRRQLAEKDEEPFAGEEGGFTIVRLKTPEALDCESDEMRHCVGHGAYDRLLDTDDYLLLSLRDGGGRSHVTIEVYNETITQCHGKANSVPKDEYREAVERLLAQKGIGFRQNTRLPLFTEGDPEARAYILARREMQGLELRFPQGFMFGGHVE